MSLIILMFVHCIRIFKRTVIKSTCPMNVDWSRYISSVWGWNLQRQPSVWAYHQFWLCHVKSALILCPLFPSQARCPAMNIHTDSRSLQIFISNLKRKKDYWSFTVFSLLLQVSPHPAVLDNSHYFLHLLC